jgi:hypothetical protein
LIKILRPLDVLGAALTATADGRPDRARAAATRLIVDHGVWLGQRIFRSYLIESGGRPMIDWASLAPAIETEDGLVRYWEDTQVLRVACSLAGVVPQDLDPFIADRWTMRSLLYHPDPTVRALILAAITVQVIE